MVRIGILVGLKHCLSSGETREVLGVQTSVNPGRSRRGSRRLAVAAMIEIGAG